MTCSTEAFLLNLTNVLILFCKPFLSREKARVDHINQYYCQFTKLINYDKFSKLCDTENSKEVLLPGLTEDFSSGKFQYVLFVLPILIRFSFIADVFFLTYQALHVGLLPATEAYKLQVQALTNTKNNIETMKQMYLLFSYSN